ncbi:leucine-rich repeat serine/threonine-protein kinase 1-like [Antedon mediterranea]|uniref:leucine-rich repeat serine/threonine-protein kinase 1-like n=1 Tax=Antedon mediterranea TaxID=105859 RepID=UPI003AF75C67
MASKEDLIEAEVEEVTSKLEEFIDNGDNISAHRLLKKLENENKFHVLRCTFPNYSRVKDENVGDLSIQQPTERSLELLHKACEKGNQEFVLFLYEYGMPLDHEGKMGTPIEIASYHGHQPIVNDLLKLASLQDKDLVSTESDIVHVMFISVLGNQYEMVTFWTEYAKDRKNIIINIPDSGKDNLYALKKYIFEMVTINEKDVEHYGSEIATILDYFVNKMEESDKLKAYWNSKNLPLVSVKFFDQPEYKGQLCSIDLSKNNLRSIPTELLWGSPWMQELNLSDNSIRQLPEPGQNVNVSEIGFNTLDLSKNKLSCVPFEVFCLEQLTILKLHVNSMKSLLKKFSRKENNDARHISWKCSKLQTLNLSNNNLSSIPRGICGATALEVLNVSGNNLNKLPRPWKCPLRILLAGANNIKEEQRDMHIYWEGTLKELDLSSNALKEIPTTVTKLVSLKTLKLASNYIKEFPEPCEWNIFGLQELDLSYNKLIHQEDTSELLLQPPRSPRSPRCRSPSPRSPVSPDSSSQFFLDLQTTKTKLEFPVSFLSSLQHLRLAGCQINSLPMCICKMENLWELDLQGCNALTRLPEKLGELQFLSRINLNGAPICQPQGIQSVIANPNGLNTKDLLRFLTNRHRMSVEFNTMKMMIIGPKHGGKTTLISSLTDIKWQEDPESGVVVKECEWDLNGNGCWGRELINKLQNSRTTVSFNIFDLKCSPELSLVHQSLMTTNTLFILVWDVRDDEEGIDKLGPWLQNIQARSVNNQVIIVGTHMDKLPSSDERKLYTLIRDRYFNSSGFPKNIMFRCVDASSLQGMGMKELKKDILDFASKFKLPKGKGNIIGRLVPRSYVLLRNIIEEEASMLIKSHRPPYLTEASLTDIVQIHRLDLETDEELRNAVLFLCDTGTVLHFNDNINSMDTVYFLSPAWLSKMLSIVLKIPKTMFQNGKIKIEEVKERYLSSKENDDWFDQYLHLLAKFEIAIRIDERRLLVPCKLPSQEPGHTVEHDSGSRNEIKRIYKMAYIPVGFWNRLLSKLIISLQAGDRGAMCTRRARKFGLTRRNRKRSPETGSKTRQEFYWQEGLVVLEDGGTFIVKSATLSGTPAIMISVTRKDSDFSAIGFIVDHINNLIQDVFPGLMGINEMNGENIMEILIPCPVCDTNKRKDSVYASSNITHQKFFNFDDCVFTATNVKEAYCRKHNGAISLQMIIPDIYMLDLKVAALDPEGFEVSKDDRLGRGGFGSVFKCEHNGQELAVKQFINVDRFLSKQGLEDFVITPCSNAFDHSRTSSCNSCCSSVSSTPSSGSSMHESDKISALKIEVVSKFANLRSEVATMTRLKHACIVQLVGVSIRGVCFAMECAPLGDLKSLLEKQLDNKKQNVKFGSRLQGCILERTITFKIAHQIVAAMEYMHGKNVIHCDLKTDNVLVWSLASEDPINIKIADYGISKISFLHQAEGEAGNPAFSAPEISRGTFDKQSDIFSFGMLIYNLMSGRWPLVELKSSLDVRNKIRQGERPKFKYIEFCQEPCFPFLEDLMKASWQSKPVDRPSSGEISERMKDPSFLCLRDIHDVDNNDDVISCAFSSKEHSLLWIWTYSDNVEGRCCRVVNMNTAKTLIIHCPGPKVNCMVEGHGGIWFGTNEHLQFYYTQKDGSIVDSPHEFKMDSPVCSLLNLKDENENIYTFAGRENGSLVIVNSSLDFNEDGTVKLEIRDMKTLFVVGQFGVSYRNSPCRAMVLTKNNEELWISSGNTIRIVNVNSMSLIKEYLTVYPNSSNHIKILVHRNGQVWCSDGSSRILQFDVISRYNIDMFKCEEKTAQSILSVLPEEELSNRTTKPSHPRLILQGNRESRVCSIQEDNNEFYIDWVYFSVENGSEKKCSTLPNSPNNFPNGMRPRSQTVERQENPCKTKIVSIHVVENTLWVSTKSGETMVINIVDTLYNRRSSELIACMSLEKSSFFVKGKSETLLAVGPDKMVSLEKLKGNAAVGNNRYRLLVWNRWSGKDFTRFDEFQSNVRKAGRKQSKTFKCQVEMMESENCDTTVNEDVLESTTEPNKQDM